MTSVTSVAVVGLWHLGSTIAACLAAAGCRVIATDPDPAAVARLRGGTPPVEEPGLGALLQAGFETGRLALEPDPGRAVREAEVVWVAFDTPVDDRDEADVEAVRRSTEALLPSIRPGATVLVSSQVPIGFTRGLAAVGRDRAGSAAAPRFVYSPENLRLGRAIESFRQPSRVLVGTEDGRPDEAVRALFARCAGGELLWMSLESAEAAKHALNAFLATSITFINEVARLCERHGADVEDVERGLRTDPRVGRDAYLAAGPAFAGGTLARDVRLLQRLGEAGGLATPLLRAVLDSNAEQRRWLYRKIEEVLGTLAGARVAVLGLTYKAGTSTLRRSAALELCAWLHGHGAVVVAQDPAVSRLPDGLAPQVSLAATAADAARGADLLVVATPWPEYRALSPDEVVTAMTRPRVIDEGRFLAGTLGADARIQYVTVGRGRARAGGARP
ncbi:MAG: nucleotide sugar dehydrogenase [Candidatus Rokuibacteriota bacterium]